MISIDPPSPSHPDGFNIVSVKITIEVEQLQFVPSYAVEYEIEQKKRGQTLATKDRLLALKEQQIKLAKKRASTDEEYNQLENELWEIQQQRTNIWNEFDGPDGNS